MAENKSEAYLEKKVLGGVTEQIVAQEKTLREVSAKLDNIDIPVSSLLRIRVYEQTFEDGTSDLTTYNCTQEVQTDQVFGGSYSLKVTIPAGQTGYVVTPSRPVSPYQRVTFSFAHKEEGDVAEVKLVAVWRRSSGGIISTEELNLTPSPEWNVDSITVVAPKQAASMELRMEATAGTSDAYVYLDEITIDLVGQIFKVDGAGNLQINIAAEEVGLLKEGGTVNIASGTVSVDNFPTEYPLPDTQVSDLKNVTIVNTPLDVNITNTSLTITGSVSVDNFPSEYPLPSSQVSDLKNVTIVGSNIAYNSTTDRIKTELPYDARDRNWTLSSSTDSVTVTGTVNVGNWRTSSTGSYGSVSVGTSATQILASNSNRKALIIYNNGDTTVYIGLDSNVTTTSGMPLPPYAYMHVKDYTGPVYGIVSSGSADVRYVELS